MITKRGSLNSTLMSNLFSEAEDLAQCLSKSCGNSLHGRYSIVLLTVAVNSILNLDAKLSKLSAKVVHLLQSSSSPL